MGSQLQAWSQCSIQIGNTTMTYDQMAVGHLLRCIAEVASVLEGECGIPGLGRDVLQQLKARRSTRAQLLSHQPLLPLKFSCQHVYCVAHRGTGTHEVVQYSPCNSNLRQTIARQNMLACSYKYIIPLISCFLCAFPCSVSHGTLLHAGMVLTLHLSALHATTKSWREQLSDRSTSTMENPLFDTSSDFASPRISAVKAGGAADGKALASKAPLSKQSCVNFTQCYPNQGDPAAKTLCSMLQPPVFTSSANISQKVIAKV